MSNIIHKEVSIPLDDDGFLRRECPYCCREFKIRKDDFESLDINKEYYCPYCGENASPLAWITKGQKELFNKIAENVAVDIINKEFVTFLKGLDNPSKGVRVTAHELERGNELINPEINDMKIIELPCCQKSIKIDQDRDSQIHCYYCGFLHCDLMTNNTT
jgi:hypothetical protein